MTVYEISICPESGFGSPIKGDTLMGHFCWQIVYQPNLVEGGLEHVLDHYLEKPFAVFSSAFPKLIGNRKGYAFKRPDVPVSWLFKPQANRKDTYEKNKDNKKKRWILADENLMIDLTQAYLTDKDIINSDHLWISQRQPHNSINRLHNKTGSNDFAPFVTENIYYAPDTELAIFVCIDNQQTNIENIKKGIENIGMFGFGKDASTGKGRFRIKETKEHKWPKLDNANACLTLAPSVPDKFEKSRIFFTPFIRFGKHGDRLVKSGRPFKNPVVMADEGAVYIPENRKIFEKPYIGRGIKGKSKALSSVYTQGYAPYLPIYLEEANEKNKL